MITSVTNKKIPKVFNRGSTSSRRSIKIRISRRDHSIR